VGRVKSTDGFLARKPALKRLASAVRRERPNTVDASRLSRGFHAKEPSVDPTRRGSLHCELARRSAKIQQEAQLSPRDRAIRRVS